MKKLFCLLALALNVAFATQTLAVLPSEGILSDDELELLTDKMREAALKVLPVSEFTLLKQDVVIKRLGGMENYIKECSETSCIVNLGKKAQVDYVAQCQIGKLGDSLRITVELYEVSTGGLLGMFSNVVDDFSKLPPMMSSHIPAVFRKITAQKQKATEPVVTSNVWNWVYGEFLFGVGDLGRESRGFLGFGVRYERMLGSRISVGGSFHLGVPSDDKESIEIHSVSNTLNGNQKIKIQSEIDAGYFYGIDAFFRLYPWGRIFYLGTAFGYHRSTNYIYSASLYNGDYGDGSVFYTAYKSGITITPEIGLKIDIGEDGGFCINLGMNVSIINEKATPDAAYFYDVDYSLTNKTKEVSASDDESLNRFGMALFYFSVGYAF